METDKVVNASALVIMSASWLGLLLCVPAETPMRLLVIFVAGYGIGANSRKAIRDVHGS